MSDAPDRAALLRRFAARFDKLPDYLDRTRPDDVYSQITYDVAAGRLVVEAVDAGAFDYDVPIEEKLDGVVYRSNNPVREIIDLCRECYPDDEREMYAAIWNSVRERSRMSIPIRTGMPAPQYVYRDDCHRFAELLREEAARVAEADRIEPEESAEPATSTASAEQYVTLDKAAAIVNRSKRTLEKKTTLPLPDVEGGGGKPNEWIWSKLRPWLEKEFGKRLPVVFPDRQPR